MIQTKAITPSPNLRLPLPTASLLSSSPAPRPSLYVFPCRPPANLLPVAGSSAPAIMIGLFVATGGLLFGYDTG